MRTDKKDKQNKEEEDIVELSLTSMMKSVWQASCLSSMAGSESRVFVLKMTVRSVTLAEL